MGSNEDQLRQLLEEGKWQAPSLEKLDAAMGRLVVALTALRTSEAWTGKAAEAANAQFLSMTQDYQSVKAAVGRVRSAVDTANVALDHAQQAYQSLPADIVPGWLDGWVKKAVDAGHTVVRPLPDGPQFAVDSAVDGVANWLTGNREQAAKTALDSLRESLAPPAATLREAKAEFDKLGAVYGDPPADNGDVPGGTTPTLPPTPGTPRVPRPPRVVTTDPPSEHVIIGQPKPPQTPVVIVGPPTRPPVVVRPPQPPEPPYYYPEPPPPERPRLEGPTDTPAPPTHQPPGLPGAGSGGSGINSGLAGGVAGGASLLGAAGTRMGTAGFGTAGFGAGGFGAGGIGGSATGGAISGTGGLLGSGGTGSPGAAGATTTGGLAGGAGKAGGEAGRSGGMMGGGQAGGGNASKDKRSRLGGPTAPKLEDDDDFSPLSESARAGSREDDDLA